MRKRVGEVTHYFNRAGVAVVELSGELSVGDLVHIYGHTTDFTQRVGSMEIDHRKVESVGPGDDFGLLVIERVRRGDAVYQLTGEDAKETIPDSAH